MDFSVNVTVMSDGTAEFFDRLKDNVQRRASLEAFSELIETTPRDTGRARAGYGLSPNGPGSYVPSVLAKPQGWKHGDAPYYQKPPQPQYIKGAEFVVVYNNVDYIAHLNNGTSSQAARLFVEKAVEKVARGFK